MVMVLVKVGSLFTLVYAVGLQVFVFVVANRMALCAKRLVGQARAKPNELPEPVPVGFGSPNGATYFTLYDCG